MVADNPGGSMRRTTTLAVGSILLSFALTGCGGSSDDASKSSSSANKTDDSSGSGSSGKSSSDTATGKATATPKPPDSNSYDDSSGTKARLPSQQTKVLNALPGSARGGCVTVGKEATVRSGAVAMGDFKVARSNFKKTNGAYDAQELNFFVIPKARKLTRAKVTFTPVSGKGKTVTVATRQHEDAAQWQYYPIHVSITSPGTYRLNVTSGNQHGCFMLKLET